MDPGDVDNRELVLLLRQYADGQASQEEVARVLREATLLLPTEKDEQEPGAQGDVAAMVEPSRRALVLENERGERAIPVFTHEGALREWAPEGGQYVGMKARDVFALAVDRRITNVLVNAASPEGIQLGETGIRALAQGG